MTNNPADTAELPEHVAANREAWDRYAHEYVEPEVYVPLVQRTTLLRLRS